MDANRFDSLARALDPGSRRTALRALAGGGLAALLVPFGQAAAKKKKKKRHPAPAPNPCAGKNWCMDRTHTCGPAGQDYRCWVTTFGGNVCGVSTATSNGGCLGCLDNEVCVLAAGGGDRCAITTSGHDVRCVRP